MIPLQYLISITPGGKKARRTDGEDGERDVLGDERLSIDEVVLLAELHELASRVADDGADDRAEGDLVQPTITERGNAKSARRD